MGVKGMTEGCRGPLFSNKMMKQGCRQRWGWEGCSAPKQPIRGVHTAEAPFDFGTMERDPRRRFETNRARGMGFVA